MKRRAYIGLATLTLSGCAGQIQQKEQTPTPTATADPVTNADYLGLLDDHDGTEIEQVEYEIHPACKATIFVQFAEEPPEDAEILVHFYRHDEKVDEETQNVGELDIGMRENVELQYCTYEKYDSFRIAVYQG